MKILTLTTLYPNAVTPHHGVFVENRLRAIAASSGVEFRVIAPVPWFPFPHRAFGRYGAYRRVPARETRFGIDIEHPRYFLPPKIGMHYAPDGLERAFLLCAEQYRQDGFDFDIIDAHYLYPDGVAATRVARRLDVPVTLTARGSDVTQLPKYSRPRKQIMEAIYNAAQVVCVAEALKRELVLLGAPEEKITVLRNGVDMTTFSERDRARTRQELAIGEAPLFVSVGHLIARKGHDVAIKTMTRLPEAHLLIIGTGPARADLEKLSRNLGVSDRVRFLGAVAHEDLPGFYSAADALILASTQEGWPNVLLEAIACGAPAVAAPVGGCAEVIGDAAAGVVAQSRSPDDFADALKTVLSAPFSRADRRRYAEKFSWEDTAAKQTKLYCEVSERRSSAPNIIPLSHPEPSAPELIVTVDTEEIFDWSTFDETHPNVADTEGVERFQSLCEEAGAKPLYFLTHAILTAPECVRFFKSLLEGGRANLGLHLHQWSTPPHRGFQSEFYSFQKNLPMPVQHEKLQSLARLFKETIGVPARAHRAGRYGIDRYGYAALAAAGVDFDFSPSPGFDQSPAGGPNFVAMSTAPFLVCTCESDVRVFPVSGARAIRGTRRFLSNSRTPPGFPAKDRAPGRFTAPLRLTCEGAALADLKALTGALINGGDRLLTFSLHSTTLTPGGNVYAPDAAAVDHALALSRAYLAMFQTQWNGRFASLDDLVNRHAPSS